MDTTLCEVGKEGDFITINAVSFSSCFINVNKGKYMALCVVKIPISGIECTSVGGATHSSNTDH
jgi:hypothetical protein